MDRVFAMSCCRFPRLCFGLGPLLLILSLGLSGPAEAASPAVSNSSVQNYAPDLFPTPPVEKESGPLPAGSLTLEDVLAAHNQKAPVTGAVLSVPEKALSTAQPPLIPTNPKAESSSTGLMLTQGMKTALQENEAVTVAPIHVRVPPPIKRVTSVFPTETVPPTTSQTAAPEPSKQSEPTPHSPVSYEPGQEPKNLAAASLTSPPPAPPSLAPVSIPPEPTPPSCHEKAEKWEKSCGEVGYPADFTGHILGETRTSCADGSLHDIWVTNTCAPPQPVGAVPSTPAPTPTPTPAPTSVPVSVSVKGQCGTAVDQASAKAPIDNLCARGTPTSVTGGGPWHWICEGTGDESAMPCEAALLTPPPEADSPPPDVKTPEKAPEEKTSPLPEKEDLCGAAAETLAYQAPDKDLCRIGTASPVQGKGPWHWVCTDKGDKRSTCQTLSLVGEGESSSASSLSSHATENTLPPPAADPATPVAATALGDSHPVETPHLKAPPKVEAPASPTCGGASGTPTRSAPDAQLCAVGTSTKVTRSEADWAWHCKFKTAQTLCAAPRIRDAVCGSANGQILANTPTQNLCAWGVAGDLKGDGPWAWVCADAKGGTSAACSANKKIPSTTSSFLKPPMSVPAPPVIPPVALPKQGKTFAETSHMPTLLTPEIPSSPVATLSGDKAPETPPELPESVASLTPPSLHEKPAQADAVPEETEPSVSVSLSRGETTLPPDLSTLVFEKRATALGLDSAARVEKLSVFLLKNPELRIALYAYAENEGSTPRDARILSLGRALVVRDALSHKGVAESRLDIHAQGANTTQTPMDRIDLKLVGAK